MRRSSMKISRSRIANVLLGAGLICLFVKFADRPASANQSGPQGYITGVVQGARGPEAAVWVIAETKDLLTNFIKIVATDDQGRFTLPELPNANYKLWVR